LITFTIVRRVIYSFRDIEARFWVL
jgi:hypothetical protein